ncbi:Lrp/AsnC family transcriptional regulator [Rhodanobacter glycinis]|uniref:Lrp/AsnC family transcriptional regulator n=1 Tax=Rhodanobacter glycinis TaxID=582702 RepID=A0A1I4B026_9GAMM|nr:Lrp/AsnC family transcriptional regulator [Rhodanobacter glycinis]QEE23482.1 Lrp/AsnC family transcriptional regulator [Rhodanobacter glycinis]SFK61196.1 Lrp/AsnC family transcriptional regulator, leucine-responsive regulatory protein [Rhodanobacter glycinis]
MASKPELDHKDWQLLEALQRDARQGYAELGRAVRLSAPAVAERVKRLEEAGVISGYRAVVVPKRLGYSIDAMIRLRCDGGICARIGQHVADIHEVLDCRRLAGEDSALLHVVAMSVAHLETVLDRLLKIHPSVSTTTLVVLQTPHADRPITRAMWDAACALSHD